MFVSFFSPKFLKIFGFTMGSRSKYWEDRRVDIRLQELAEGVDISIDRVYEIWQEKSRLISGLDYTMWAHAMHRAGAGCTKAADDFSWAHLLAKKAGFKVKNSYRDRAYNGVAPIA